MARDFKGVWIPKEIWLHKDLSLVEKCLLIEIDSLDNSPERGCFASNKYFADFFQLSESRIANILTDLKKRGYIKQVYFDGRNRGLRSQHREICFTENGKADLPKKGKQTTRKREHNNTVNNTVEDMYSTNVEYRETVGEVANEFEVNGEPIPTKQLPKQETPPRFRATPPKDKTPNQVYTLYEAYAKFCEGKGIPMSRNANGNFEMSGKDAKAISTWVKWAKGMPGAGDPLNDWTAYLDAAWQHGDKFIRGNFEPTILYSKAKTIVIAVNKHRIAQKELHDAVMQGSGIDDLLNP